MAHTPSSLINNPGDDIVRQFLVSRWGREPTVAEMDDISDQIASGTYPGAWLEWINNLYDSQFPQDGGSILDDPEQLFGATGGGTDDPQFARELGDNLFPEDVEDPLRARFLDPDLSDSERLGLRRGTFSQELGFPSTSSLSPFQAYLNRQFGNVSSAFDVNSAFQLRADALAGRERPTEDFPGFLDFLRERSGGSIRDIGRGQFGQVADLSSEEQGDLLFGIPGGAQAAENSLIQRRLRGSAPAALAAGYAQRLGGAPARQAFSITPEAQQGGTFLSFLQRKYGL